MRKRSPRRASNLVLVQSAGQIEACRDSCIRTRKQTRVLPDIGDTSRVEQHRGFSSGEAREIGELIGINWKSSRFDVEQFRMGLGVELEHGRRDSATNVSDDDRLTTGKIAWAHLNEFPDYYTRLAKMEAQAEQYWSEQER